MGLKFEYTNNIFTVNEFKSRYEKNRRYLYEAQKQHEYCVEKRENKKFTNDLGWLNTNEWSNEETVDNLLQKAEKVKKKADVFVVIGVGGSNKAAISMIEAFKTPDSPEILYLGNNVSAQYINNVLAGLEGLSVYINVIAKNFETLEPGIGFRIMRKYLYEKYGDSAHERIFITGTRESHLNDLSDKYNYTFLSFPNNIGGRYSVFSNVGLFPMAVAGVNIKSLLKGAKDIEHQLTNQSKEKNIALEYATYRNILRDKGYDIEVLAYFDPRFDYFSEWWIQLFAESEGKQNKGIFPVSASYSEDLHSLGQYIQDGKKIIFETFIEVINEEESYILEKDHINDHFDYLNNKDLTEINKNILDATYESHSQGGIPTSKLSILELTPYGLGQTFYFFMFSCYLSGLIQGINPFNQPGVENYKELMFDKLDKSSTSDL